MLQYLMASTVSDDLLYFHKDWRKLGLTTFIRGPMKDSEKSKNVETRPDEPEPSFKFRIRR